MGNNAPTILRRGVFQRSKLLRGLWNRWQAVVDFCDETWRVFGESSQNKVALAGLVRRRFDHQAKRPEAPHRHEKVDASFVTFNSEKWLQGLLSSVESQNHDLGRLHLTFVDHGSVDGTLDFLKDYARKKGGLFASFSVLERPNRGYGAGHDCAINTTRSPWILISNVDVEWSHDLVSGLLQQAVNDDNDVVAWEPRQMPFEHPKHYDPVTGETTWQSHACVLMRRSAYNEVGGYDPAFFMYGEDVELSYRLRSHGYRLRYCPAVTINHHHHPCRNHHSAGLQTVGSVIGNARNRLKYGSIFDKLIGIALTVGCLIYPSRRLSGFRRRLYSGVARVGSNLHEVPRGATECGFPFRLFSYEQSREGAGYSSHRANEEKLVSIVTRTQGVDGRAEYLRQAGLSVSNQTHRAIEWIVVQDGGDSQRAIVQEIAEAAPSLKVKFIALPRVGRSVAGNTGLEEATGKFCMFLDDDDLLYADHVEMLIGAIDSAGVPAAYSLAFEVRTEPDEKTLYHEAGMRTPKLHRQPWSYEILQDHNFIPIQALLFERRLYTERGGFDTSLDQLEDWNLWLRYGYGNNFEYVPKTTSLFRTPARRMIRDQRAALLHKAYFEARDAAFRSLRGAGIML